MSSKGRARLIFSILPSHLVKRSDPLTTRIRILLIILCDSQPASLTPLYRIELTANSTPPPRWSWRGRLISQSAKIAQKSGAIKRWRARAF